MSTSVSVYLQNHEAAGQAGHDLFRRVASAQRRRAYGPDLDELADDVRDDLASLQMIMAELGVRPSPLLGAALRIGERLGRLKPNGALIRRPPLTDLVEIEALVTIVHAKRSGWTALLAAKLEGGGPSPELLTTLRQRADEQIARLSTIHDSVSTTVLT